MVYVTCDIDLYITDGVYYGMNSALDPKMRILETNDISHKDNNESSGTRNLRLRYLLFNKRNGKLNVNNAKTILSASVLGEYSSSSS